MCFHKQPATQTDQDANNVRNDEYGYNTFVAMPSIPQQDPGHNAIKPGRRERVADPARDLIRRQRAVEAARSGHLVYLLVVRRRRVAELCGRRGGVKRHSAARQNGAAAWLRRTCTCQRSLPLRIDAMISLLSCD